MNIEKTSIILLNSMTDPEWMTDKEDTTHYHTKSLKDDINLSKIRIAAIKEVSAKYVREADLDIKGQRSRPRDLKDKNTYELSDAENMRKNRQCSLKILKQDQRCKIL